MSYYKQLMELCNQIHTAAKHAETHQQAIAKYTNPKSQEAVWLAGEAHRVFWADGTPNPIVDDIRLAHIKAGQDQVVRYKSQLESLRWKMAQLMKEAA